MALEQMKKANKYHSWQKQTPENFCRDRKDNNRSRFPTKMDCIRVRYYLFGSDIIPFTFVETEQKTTSAGFQPIWIVFGIGCYFFG